MPITAGDLGPCHSRITPHSREPRPALPVGPFPIHGTPQRSCRCRGADLVQPGFRDGIAACEFRGVLRPVGALAVRIARSCNPETGLLPLTEQMTPLRPRMIDDMAIRNPSRSSIHQPRGSRRSGCGTTLPFGSNRANDRSGSIAPSNVRSQRLCCTSAPGRFGTVVPCGREHRR
jgi:hypothetical protein